MLLSLMAFVFVWLGNPAFASQPESGTDQADFGLFKDKVDEKQEDKTAEQKAAEEEAERKRKEKLARVIVLKWKDTTTDYKDETVRRNVRSRIARPEGMFFPEVDLYQNGRKVLDRTVIPAMQPAVVPDANMGVVKAAVDQIAGVPWNQMQPAEWGLKAQELRALAEQLWFVDRVALREPLFLLYSQIGRAAENQNFSAPPFYEQVGSFAVNYYFYLAATLAYQEPSLMSKLTDQELSGSIGYYLQQLQQGSFPSLKVDFEQENAWNEEEFNKDYEVLVNGIAVVPDGNAQIDIFLGRTDIYLKRKDTGHGLSERLEVAKLDDKIYAVREVARKLMGIDFIDQLFLHKNECTPQVDGNILNYLAIYAKLHDKAEIYIAVPEFGNPNRMWIWRYDRPSAQLSLVGGGGDGFPVRFAFVFSTGLLSNGATIAVDDDLSDESDLSPERLADANRINTELDSATVPFNFELRGHYNRLMINLGAEFGYNASGDADGWIEYYQTPGNQSEEDIGTFEMKNCTDPNDATTCSSVTEVFNERTFSRNLYLGVGIVLGRDAGIGFGPRFAFRWDWATMPHGWQPTLHFGWALQPPIFKAGGRVRPLVDLDLRGGVNIDRDRSIHKDIASELDDDEGTVMPLFGGTLGVGLTF
jgi:hypothetical protein